MIGFKRLTAVLLTAVMLLAMVPVSADKAWESMTREEYIFDNWRYKAVNSDSLAYIDNTVSAGGESSLKIYSNTVRGAGENYIWVAKPVSVEEGKTYRIEFDVKIENAISDVHFRFDWSGWSLIPSVTTYDWNTLAFTYQSAKSGNMELRWGSDNKIGGMWIDNVKFYDVENPDVNLVKNGDFENLSGLAQAPVTAVSDGNDDDLYSMTGTQVVVDGKADEWDDVTSYPIDQHFELTNGTWQKHGVVPISADIKFTHDS